MLDICNNRAATHQLDATISRLDQSRLTGPCSTMRARKKTGFMPTTSISTPFGWRCVASIVKGDEVLAQDGTVRVVADVCHSTLNRSDIMDEARDRPVRIPTQSLGNMTELSVYPDQMLHVPHPVTDFSGPSLVKAKELIGVNGIRPLDPEEMQLGVSLLFRDETVISCAHGGFAICDGVVAPELLMPRTFWAA